MTTTGRPLMAWLSRHAMSREQSEQLRPYQIVYCPARIAGASALWDYMLSRTQGELPLIALLVSTRAVRDEFTHLCFTHNVRHVRANSQKPHTFWHHAVMAGNEILWAHWIPESNRSAGLGAASRQQAKALLNSHDGYTLPHRYQLDAPSASWSESE